MDLTSLLRKRLSESRRPPDGKLHPSGDLLGSLRHAQLRLAGAPTIESQIVSDTRLMTGTMWHKLFEEILADAGVETQTELSVTPGLPEGWSGTADWLFKRPEDDAWVLGDLKSIKGEGMKWVLKDGAKEEHIWQLSAYWWALYNMGARLVKGFAIYYLPMNDTTERDELIEPVLMECDPLPQELLWGVMEDRWQAVQRYLPLVDEVRPENYTGRLARNYIRKPENFWMPFINKELAPEIGRIQKLYWNGKQKVFDVKLVPHWSAQFCPYPTELCGCSEQGSNKIGHYTLEGEYVPRKGEEYENVEPLVAPSESDYKNKRKEADASSEQEPVGEAA